MQWLSSGCDLDCGHGGWPGLWVRTAGKSVCPDSPPKLTGETAGLSTVCSRALPQLGVLRGSGPTQTYSIRTLGIPGHGGWHPLPSYSHLARGTAGDRYVSTRQTRESSSGRACSALQAECMSARFPRPRLSEAPTWGGQSPAQSCKQAASAGSAGSVGPFPWDELQGHVLRPRRDQTTPHRLTAHLHGVLSCKSHSLLHPKFPSRTPTFPSSNVGGRCVGEGSVGTECFGGGRLYWEVPS